MNLYIDEKIKTLPEGPGVYIFKNIDKKVLYVGKAINLKNRVKSYFLNVASLEPKTKALVEKVSEIENINVDNEIEALLLESDLIKRFRPPYNINLKDDKFYKFITISKDKTSSYKIGTTRKVKDDKTLYIGPFPEASSIEIIIKTLRKIFPFRDCTIQKFNNYKRLNRPCLYGYIGVCPAPCQGDKEIVINNDNVRKIKEYLTGNRKQLFNKIKSEMKKASIDQRYEDAALLRDQLNSYNYITQSTSNIREYIESPNIKYDRQLNGLQELIKTLSINGIRFSEYELEKFRTETYDISNIQGKNAVGSMVVFEGGVPDKKEYRRFAIKLKDTPDDFSMMKEVLNRRFKNTKWNKPDLIIIDGGKGQLSSALDILTQNNIDIPVISLAKRNEEIIIWVENKFKTLSLDKNSSALKVLQSTRDEAHRFAVSYYRNIHRRNLLK
jgi:excinuclease ABC subunit C